MIPVADDFEAIRARLAEIEAEKQGRLDEAEMQRADEPPVDPSPVHTMWGYLVP